MVSKDKIDYKKQGKRNQQAGARFERKVRADLESKGWIVSKWQNNVELKVDPVTIWKYYLGKEGKLVPAKQGRFRKTSTGFPDFIAFKNIKINSLILNELFNDVMNFTSKFDRDKNEKYCSNLDQILNKMKNSTKWTDIIGVECKTNGYLSKEEKKKCKWLLDNNIFRKILIASKGEKRGSIEYKEFEWKN